MYIDADILIGNHFNDWLHKAIKESAIHSIVLFWDHGSTGHFYHGGLFLVNRRISWSITKQMETVDMVWSLFQRPESTYQGHQERKRRLHYAEGRHGFRKPIAGKIRNDRNVQPHHRSRQENDSGRKDKESGEATWSWGLHVRTDQGKTSAQWTMVLVAISPWPVFQAPFRK